MRDAVTIAAVVITLALAAPQQATATDSVSPDDASLTVLGVRVGGSETLIDVVSRFGPATIWQTGDASTSTSQVCYRLSTVEPSPLIWFGSNNAMSDPKGQVNHIVVYADAHEFRDHQRCSRLKRPVAAMRTPSGLKLGMTVVDARRILRTAQFEQKRLRHTVWHKQYLEPTDARYALWAAQTECFPDSSRPYFDDAAQIVITFKAGRASRLRFDRNQFWC
jgi:hypothetical protein